MDSRIKKDPEQMFECYVEYLRPQDGESPEIKRLYPRNHQFDEDLKKNLSKFVFPTKDPQTNAEEHFTFCLTDLQGKFRFGFCRYPARGEVCSCFISDLPWFKVFYRILDKLAECQLDHQNELIEPFLTSLYKHAVPSVGTDTVMTIVPEGINTGQVYTFPLPNPRRLPEIPTDHNLTLFYPTLHHQVILCLYANLLFERRIIITSSSLKTLSAAVHGCVLLLYPLFWQHIFIPITPHHLIDYCAAPMPFLMGIHSSMMEQVRQMPINDAVILDVDQSELESPYYEDLLSIPPVVSSVLRSAIKKSSSAYGDTAAKAFLQANVALLGGYRSALKMREGESEVSFDRESFIKSRPQMEEFLSLLLEFQHFQQFLNGRIERLKSNKERDLFDEEVIVYEDDMKSGKWSSDQMKVAWKDMRDILQKHSNKVAKNTRTFMKDTKNLFQKGNEKIGDIYGDWTPSTLTDKYKSSTLPVISGSRGGGGGGEGRTRHKAPPPVIPYMQHREGMDKLKGMLQEQRKRNSIVDTPYLYTTPTDRHTPDDIAESSSISSKDSLEVATGQLIDLSDHTHLERGPTPTIFRPGDRLSEEGETDSASIISSSSSSSGSVGGTWEVTKNEHAESPPVPPIPPPRKKHLKEGGASGRGTPNAKPIEEFELVNTGDSLLVNTGDSLSDLSSSIADALIKNSRRISDPMTAGSVSTTAQQLHKSVQDTPFNSHSDILVSTHATPTFNSNTTSESHLHILQVNEFDGCVGGRGEELPPNDPWQPIVTTSGPDSPNPFKPGGASLGRATLGETSLGGVSPGTSRRPPVKPQPYSGSGLKYFEKMLSSNPNAVLTPTNVSTVGNSSKEVSPDPLANLFGQDGLQGYANMK